MDAGVSKDMLSPTVALCQHECHCQRGAKQVDKRIVDVSVPRVRPIHGMDEVQTRTHTYKHTHTNTHTHTHTYTHTHIHIHTIYINVHIHKHTHSDTHTD